MKALRFSDVSQAGSSLPSSCWRFSSGKPGPAVTIFGGVHGNEVSGIEAIMCFRRIFESGHMQLAAGSLTLCLGNEEAASKGVRQVEDRNLNRMFGRGQSSRFHPHQGSYEWQRVKELELLINSSDVVLDLHSTSSRSEPFFVVHSASLELASRLGISRQFHVTEEFPLMRGICSAYAQKLGKAGITLEAGQHDCPEAKIVAATVIKRLLVQLGLVEVTDELRRFADFTGVPRNYLRAVYIQEKTSDNFRLEREFRNFEELKPGEVFARDGHKTFRVSQSLESAIHIALPTPPKKQAVGEEVCIFAAAKTSLTPPVEVF